MGKSACQKGPGKARQWMGEAQAGSGMSLVVQHDPELPPICTIAQKENMKKHAENTETQH